MSRHLFTLLAVLLGVFAAPSHAWGADTSPFPRPAAIEHRVDFWKRIYTEVATDQGLIHDSVHLDVVYGRVEIAESLPRRTRSRRVKAAKKGYADTLRVLAKGKRSGLSAEQKRVLALWPSGVSNKTLSGARQRLRFQRGQANKFRDGLIRSGRWRDFIRDRFEERGLPTELGALPHVESSFNPRAYSKVGAAGIWQFTRSTGRRYMTINSVVDERMNPEIATRSAARLLEDNFKITGDWALAITAYNHGAAGMRRAKKRLGTSDIDTIIKKYKSRTFGFASRNFYCSFLAALDIDRDPARYFGAIHYESPEALTRVVLDAHYPSSALARAFGIEVGLLQQLNPALRRAVWSGQKRIPQGYELLLPKQTAAPDTILASIPNDRRFTQQTRDRYHKVRRGETLSIIARRHGVSIRTLMEMNNLRSRHRIRSGQRLRLPDAPADQVAERPGRAVPVSTAWEGDHYRVRRGESLVTIARRVGSTPRELARANGIRNPNRIQVGQMLKVPSREKATIKDEAPVVAKPEAAPVTPAPETVEPPVEEAIAEKPPAAAAPLVEVTPPSDPEVPSTKAEVAVEAPEAVAAAIPVAEAAAPGSPRHLADNLMQRDPERWIIKSNRVVVQTDETLGHYADWLELPTQKIRSLNKMSGRSEIVVGKRIRLDFSKVSESAFRERRLEHHRMMRVAFLEENEISGTQEHILRRGETLWEISRSRYGIPLWLVRDYNPDVDFTQLRAGLRLQIPEVTPRSS